MEPSKMTEMMKNRIEFEPFLGFSSQLLQQTQSVNLLKQIMNPTNKNQIYIGLLDIKQDNLKLMLPNYSISRIQTKDQPIMYMSRQVLQPSQQGSSQPRSIRYIYLSNIKSQTQHHNLLASILIFVSKYVVYEFNSKYVRNSKPFQGAQFLLKQFGLQPQSKLKKQFVLISQTDKSYVYKISITESNRMQIKQKLAFPYELLQQINEQNKSQVKNKLFSIWSIKQILKFYFTKQVYLFQDKNTEFLGEVVFLTYYFLLEIQKKSKLFRHMKESQNQNDVVFYTFQNLQALVAELENLALSIKVVKFNENIHKTIFQSMLQQLQLFKQTCLINVFQNLQNQYFAQHQNDKTSQNYLLQSQELRIKQCQIKKKLISSKISPEYSSLITNKFESNLMKGHIKKLEQTIFHQQAELQQKQNELLKRQIKINFQQTQLQQQSKRNFLLKQISQQLSILQQRLSESSSDKRKLKIDIQAYLNQIKQSKQRQVRLQGIINAYRQEKNNMLEAIGKLTKQNLEYLSQIKQKQNQIFDLQQKNSHYQHIERTFIAQKQKSAILQKNLAQFKKYQQEVQNNWKTFKTRQAQKFNFILAENWSQYQKQIKKSGYLQAKMDQMESKFIIQQKQKQIIQIQLQHFQKTYYQKCCSSLCNSQTKNWSRQNTFYNNESQNQIGMQQIFEQIQQDLTTDRQKAKGLA